MQEILLGAFNTLQRSIELISIQDIIDMGIIAYVIYRGMKFSGKRSTQLNRAV